MKKEWEILFILIGIFLLINIIYISSEEVRVESDVYKALDKENEVKIVVEIKEPNIANSQKDEIKEEIINQVGEENIRHEFDNHISMEVNENELEKLKLNDNIKLISPVGIVHAFLQDSIPLMNASSTRALQVNNINLTGIGETVCILDTGINFSHPDLIGKNRTACLINCLGGNCYQDCSILDDHGHGTHVAGIAGASGGIKGVGIGLGIIGVKVLYSDGSGSFDDVDAGIDWCINNKDLYNISVISMSLGTNATSDGYSSYCDGYSSLTTSLINRAIANNISVTIASGNDGNKTRISFPACIKNATAVGASTKADAMWGSTNRNSLLDFLAPGESINSTRWNPLLSRLGFTCTGNYCIVSGTSMATPHVAGAFAIINQLYKLEYNRSATPSEIQNIFNLTSKKINDSSGTGLNFSRIDLYSAILYSDIINPVVNLTFPTNNNINSSLNMTFNCEATDWQLSNITFYLWNSTSLIYNETKPLTGTSNSSLFNYTLYYGNYRWNCLSKDAKNNFAFASSNNSLIIDFISVNLTSPLNQTYIKINDTLINNTVFICNSSTGGYGILKNTTLHIWNSTSLVYNQSRNITGNINSSIFYYNLTKEETYQWNCLSYNNYSNFSLAPNNNTIIYDITNPIISNLGSSVSTTSSTISFTTNEICNYSINYGLSENLSNSLNESSFSISNSKIITGLSSSTTYYYNVTYCDIVGNCLTNGTHSFTTSTPVVVSSSGGGGGGGSGGGTSNTALTYFLSNNEIISGTSKQIKEKEKIKFVIQNESDHMVVLNNLTENYVNITIFSNPINITLNVNEERKLNLSSPEYYDLYIRLNSIINKTANITLRSINETIIPDEIEVFINNNQSVKNDEMDNSKSYYPVFYFIGIVFIVVIILIIILISLKKKKSKIDKLGEYRGVFNKNNPFRKA